MNNDNSVSIESLRAEVENDHRFKTSYRGYEKKSVNAYISSLERQKKQEIDSLKEEIRSIEDRNSDMRTNYQRAQREMEAMKHQRQRELDNLKSEYEAKLQELLEENTKKILAENAEETNRLQALIDEKNNQLQISEKEMKSKMDEVISQKNQEIEDIMVQKDKEMQDVVAEKDRKISELIEQKDREIQNLGNKLKNRDEAEKKMQESAIEGYKAANDRLTEENNKKKVRIADLEEKLALASSNLDNNMKMIDSLNIGLSEMLVAKFGECEDIIAVWAKQYQDTSNAIKEQLNVAE